VDAEDVNAGHDEGLAGAGYAEQLALVGAAGGEPLDDDVVLGDELLDVTVPIRQRPADHGGGVALRAMYADNLIMHGELGLRTTPIIDQRSDDDAVTGLCPAGPQQDAAKDPHAAGSVRRPIRKASRVPAGQDAAPHRPDRLDIADFDAKFDEHVAPFAATVDRLVEIPGIGAVAAEVLIAEIDLDMSRFPTAAHLAGWDRRAHACSNRPARRRAPPAPATASTISPTSWARPPSALAGPKPSSASATDA
jgi:hypothetical protein